MTGTFDNSFKARTEFLYGTVAGKSPFGKDADQIAPFASLDKEGNVKVSDFANRDAEILRIAFLFAIYHDFLDEFDGHIRKQLDSGDRPAPVPFAAKAFAAFLRRGFHEAETCRYLLFFFSIHPSRVHFSGRNR